MSSDEGVTTLEDAVEEASSTIEDATTNLVDINGGVLSSDDAHDMIQGASNIVSGIVEAADTATNNLRDAVDTATENIAELREAARAADIAAGLQETVGAAAEALYNSIEGSRLQGARAKRQIDQNTQAHRRPNGTGRRIGSKES